MRIFLIIENSMFNTVGLVKVLNQGSDSFFLHYHQNDLVLAAYSFTVSFDENKFL